MSEHAQDEDWRAFANCATTDPEIFFAQKGNSTATRMARKVCAACTVVDQCLADALTDDDPQGFRAGHTIRELRRMRREQGLSRAATVDERAELAHAMRDEGKSLEEIARRLGYANHSGAAALLARRPSTHEPEAAS